MASNPLTTMDELLIDAIKADSEIQKVVNSDAIFSLDEQQSFESPAGDSTRARIWIHPGESAYGPRAGSNLMSFMRRWVIEFAPGTKRRDDLRDIEMAIVRALAIIADGLMGGTMTAGAEIEEFKWESTNPETTPFGQVEENSDAITVFAVGKFDIETLKSWTSDL